MSEEDRMKTNTWQKVNIHLQCAYAELDKARTATGPHVEDADEYDDKLTEVMETLCSAIDELHQLAEWSCSMRIRVGDDV
jgi:predicted DNA-binding ArsR family transcriptional regulator